MEISRKHLGFDKAIVWEIWPSAKLEGAGRSAESRDETWSTAFGQMVYIQQKELLQHISRLAMLHKITGIILSFLW